MDKQSLILATTNAGKIRELSALLSALPFRIISQQDVAISDADEKGLTFIENALIKARHAAIATGLPAIADDSGLCVSALNDAPGIYTARYAGQNADAKQNIAKLLHELNDVPFEKRDAYFHCVLVFIKHANDPRPIIAEGTWHGKIAFEPSGVDGFGYDPVFVVPSHEKTAAELPLDLKNQLSHRGQALRTLLQRLTSSRESL